jgi:predicted transcriptional regulator
MGSAVPLRRSKLDIVLSVLSAVREGADKPTRIMYAANLSWKPTKRILASLVEQGLLSDFENVESKRSKKRYGITEKGLNIIEYFKKAQGLFEIDDILALD